MEQNNILTYLNFSKKSKSIVFGIDNINAYRKNIYCVLIDKTASKNLQKSVRDYSKKQNVPTFEIQNIDELLKTKNCKVLGLTNENLAKQIIKILEE